MQAFLLPLTSQTPIIVCMLSDMMGVIDWDDNVFVHQFNSLI